MQGGQARVSRPRSWYTLARVILDDILRRTRGDLAARRERVPLAALEAACLTRPPARDLTAALRRPGQVSCIAEHKRRSPSAGWIREGSDAADIAAGYARAGAAAISMLTDEPFFGGSLEDLRRARAAVEIPILRKDFFVDGYQVVEARAAGADAILIIVAALADRDIATLLATAEGLGMEALVEVHDEVELQRALALDATLIGVNNRDLKTFSVDRELAPRLRAQIPVDRLVVAESGIRDTADVARLRAAGIEAMLVGETLMRAPDPGAALAALLAGAG
jgi:indole-3-glycerol phosphate synthase